MKSAKSVLAATSVFKLAIEMYPGMLPFTPSTSKVELSANTDPVKLPTSVFAVTVLDA